MKKKKVRRLSSATRKRTTPISSYRSFFAIALGVLAVIIVGKVIISSFHNSSTLGTTTYLAKGDDSDSGSSGSGNSGSGSSGSDSSGSGSSGSDSSDSDGSGNGSNGSGSNNPSNTGSTGGNNTSESSGSSTIPTKTETRDTTTGVRTQTEIKQDETRTEVRLSEEERIRTRTKDGETRIDINSGGVKTRLEYRDDRVIIKAEQEDGTEVELEDDTIFKIEEQLGTSGIKVATAGAEKFVIQRGNAGAVTDLPLSIDLETNTLSVNTPSGIKTVTVLPDQAVQNLIAANVVNRLGDQAVVNEVQNNNLASIDQLVTLGIQNDIPVYEINGISDQRLLGFIPVTIEKEIAVSAETGEVVSTDVSLGDRILDLISF